MKTTTHQDREGNVTVTIKGDVQQMEQLSTELNKAASADTPRVANLGNEVQHAVDTAKK